MDESVNGVAVHILPLSCTAPSQLQKNGETWKSQILLQKEIFFHEQGHSLLPKETQSFFSSLSLLPPPQPLAPSCLLIKSFTSVFLFLVESPSSSFPAHPYVAHVVVPCQPNFPASKHGVLVSKVVLGIFNVNIKKSFSLTLFWDMTELLLPTFQVSYRYLKPIPTLKKLGPNG